MPNRSLLILAGVTMFVWLALEAPYILIMLLLGFPFWLLVRPAKEERAAAREQERHAAEQKYRDHLVAKTKVYARRLNDDAMLAVLQQGGFDRADLEDYVADCERPFGGGSTSDAAAPASSKWSARDVFGNADRTPPGPYGSGGLVFAVNVRDGAGRYSYQTIRAPTKTDACRLAETLYGPGNWSINGEGSADGRLRTLILTIILSFLSLPILPFPPYPSFPSPPPPPVRYRLFQPHRPLSQDWSADALATGRAGLSSIMETTAAKLRARRTSSCDRPA